MHETEPSGQRADGQQASLLALSRRSRRASEQETSTDQEGVTEQETLSDQEAVAEQATLTEQEAVDADYPKRGEDGAVRSRSQQPRGFRHWCRQRPFISGLLVVLGGIELFFSSQLDTGNLQIQFGIEGLQATVIPIALVLLGASAIFKPTHHVFYGIIALVLGVYSLIGVNLGGFILGMLLTSIGAVLVVAWMGPREPRAKRSKKSRAQQSDAEAAAAERRGNQETVGEERDS